MHISWGYPCQTADLISRFPFSFVTEIMQVLEIGAERPIQLALMLEAHQGEARNGQLIELRIRDERGIPVYDYPAKELGWLSLGPGYPILSGVNIPGWWPDWPGAYQIIAWVDGILVDGSVRFYGVRRGAGAPRLATSVPRQGFELEWAHVALHDADVTDPPVRREGTSISIDRIIRFVPCPDECEEMAFNGYYIAGVTAGTDEAQDHRYHLELHGPDGEVLRRFTEVEGSLHFASAGPESLGHAYLGFLVRNVIFPGIGEYSFVLFINDERIGAIDFWIVAPAVPGLGAGLEA